jgi:hypothetical protein
MEIVAVSERAVEPGARVRRAIDVMKGGYGAVLTHDSGHAKGPTWIYTFPDHGHAQVAIRMNKEALSLYVRDRTPDGRPLEPLLGGLADVTGRYPNADGTNPANSLMSDEHAAYLNPRRQPLLLISPRDEALTAFLDLYLGRATTTALSDDGTPASSGPEGSSGGTSPRRRGRAIDADAFAAQLDRNNATGRAGELIALADELRRLREECGCPAPEGFVEHVAQTDVGRGYDIASRWPGHERCIEVKSSTTDGDEFFLSEREREVLGDLGAGGWIYRVRVTGDGAGSVVERLQDPVGTIPDEAMAPVVWRVRRPR